MKHRWLVFVLATVACTNERSIGSACVDGMCEMPPASTRIPCLISTGEATIRSAPSSFESMCLANRLHKDEDDMVRCRMLYVTSDPDRSCADLGFEASDGDGSIAPMTCEIPQLEAFEREMTGDTASGWYVDGPPLPSSDGCATLGSTQHARINGELPVAGVTWLMCAEAFADPGAVSPALRTGEAVLHVDPDSCSGVPPLSSRLPEDVGFVCTTRFPPPGGFFTDRTYLDVRSEQCETGICLVDATRSPTQWPCPPGEMCAAPQLDDDTYCSCRCDAKGDTSRVPCLCPVGYSCRDVLGPDAPPSLAGGYCMRDDF